ncbi:MAG: hypothetical protein WB621_14845 [Candidatus Acidiferrales bacterium]
MSHPIIDEEFPAFACLQDRFTESPERVETDAYPPHLLSENTHPVKR